MGTADLIVRDALIVTMDATRRVIPDGVLVVAGAEITAVGDAALLQSHRADRVIDAAGDIVMPGMINTHCHAAMTVFRGLGDDVADRLRRYIFPLEAKVVSQDMVYWSSLHAIVEMIEAGVTTFADMYYFEEAVARAAAEAGMRVLPGQTVIGFSAPDHAAPAAAIEAALRLADAYAGHPLVTPALAPHAPYTLTTAELRHVAAAARDAGLPVLTHLAETREEHDTVRREEGKSPVAYLDDLGLLTSRLVAAHCIFVDGDDIARLAAAGAGVSHNPVSNMKSGKGIAPVPEMAARGVRVGLGTDGAMSGNTLDILAPMSLAAKAHKLAAGDRTVAPAADMVALATIGGARALHMEDTIGSLEPGKRADFAIVDTKATHMQPLHDVYAALVYAANPADVHTTVIDGRIVMRDRQVQTIDRAAIMAEVARLAGFIRGLAANLDAS